MPRACTTRATTSTTWPFRSASASSYAQSSASSANSKPEHGGADRTQMGFFRVYGRVIGLLRPEKGLVIVLALANIAVAGLQFYEPVLFGKVVDLLANAKNQSTAELWYDARR